MRDESLVCQERKGIDYWGNLFWLGMEENIGKIYLVFEQFIVKLKANRIYLQCKVIKKVSIYGIFRLLCGATI